MAGGEFRRSDPRYKSDAGYRKAVHSAEYRARSEKAKSAGYEKGYSEARRRRSAGEPAPGDKTGRRQVVNVAGMTMLSTYGGGKGERTLLRGLAARADQRVLYVNVRQPDGTWRKVYSKGISVAGLLDAANRAGSMADAIAAAAAAANYLGGVEEADDGAEDGGGFDFQVVLG